MLWKARPRRKSLCRPLESPESQKGRVCYEEALVPQNPLCERYRTGPGLNSGFLGDIQHGLYWDSLKWGYHGGPVKELASHQALAMWHSFCAIRKPYCTM